MIMLTYTVYPFFSVFLTLLIELLYQICWRAAENIMELLSAWRAAYTLRYVPVTIIQIVFAAGTVYLRASTLTQTEASLLTLPTQRELIVQFLDEIGESWHYANNIADFVRKFIDEGFLQQTCCSDEIQTRPTVPIFSPNVPDI
jgi:hypothetical protein